MKKFKIILANLFVMLVFLNVFHIIAMQKVVRESNPIPFDIIDSGNIQMAQYYLNHGASLNSKYEPGLDFVFGNHTALSRAISHKNIEMIAFLLKNGADVNQVIYNKPWYAISDSGITPLMQAVGYGSPEIVSLLIENGAKVNDQDYEGDTALMRLVIWCQQLRSFNIKELVKILKILLHANADVNIANKKGKTFLSIINEPIYWDNWYSDYRAHEEMRKQYLETYLPYYLRRQKIKFMEAFKNNHFEIIYEILRKSPELIDQQNEIGETILREAILFGRFEFIKELFENPNIKVKPNLLVGRISNYLFDETNPVEYAIKLGRPGCDPAKQIYRDIAAYLKKQRDLQEIQEL